MFPAVLVSGCPRVSPHFLPPPKGQSPRPSLRKECFSLFLRLVTPPSPRASNVVEVLLKFVVFPPCLLPSFFPLSGTHLTSFNRRDRILTTFPSRTKDVSSRRPKWIIHLPPPPAFTAKKTLPITFCPDPSNAFFVISRACLRGKMAYKVSSCPPPSFPRYFFLPRFFCSQIIPLQTSLKNPFAGLILAFEEYFALMPCFIFFFSELCFWFLRSLDMSAFRNGPFPRSPPGAGEFSSLGAPLSSSMTRSPSSWRIPFCPLYLSLFPPFARPPLMSYSRG